MRLEEMLLNIFRVITVNEKVKGMNIQGLVETVRRSRTNLYKFDPLKVNLDKLIDGIMPYE